MKFKKKLALLLTLTVALSLLLPATAFAADDTTSGFSVMLGATPVVFSDAEPEARSGRIFVPARAVFEAMGAQVSYESATQTVTAVRGDSTVSFTVGQSSLHVLSEGVSQTLETDAAPYISGGRVMIPVRFAAEGFGCNVGWDSSHQTVLILDMESMLGDAQYTLMDKYLTYFQGLLQSGYAVSGSLDLTGNVTEDGTSVPFSVTGTVTGLCDSSAVNLDVEAEMDLDDLFSLAGTADSGVGAQLALDMLKDVEVEYIFSYEDGMLYLRSPLLSFLMGVESDAWVSMDVSDILDGYGALDTLMNTTSFREYLTCFLSAYPLTCTDDLTNISQTMEILRALFADESYTQNGDVYTNTQTLTEDGTTVQYDLTFTLEDGQFASLAMNFAVSDGVSSVELSGTVGRDSESVTMTMNMEDAMDMTMQLDMQFEETTQVPLTEPPADSTVIPMN